MRLLRTAAGLWCIACLALVACGQERVQPVAEPTPEAATAPTTAVAMPKPEPVSVHIPADAMGYVVVRDVGATMGRVDKYLADIGLTEMIAPVMPNGAMEAIKLQAMLGEGFNPSGGFAVVMLDPQKFGVNLLSLMGLEEEPVASQPEGQAPPEPPKLPVVILVPGMSVQSVFGGYEITPAGKYSQVALRMGPMLATQLGGYVCLSPNAAALDALTAPSTAAPAMAAEQADLIARSDLAIHVNMEVAAPLLDKLLGKVQDQMGHGMAPQVGVGLWSAYMGFYKDLLSQMTGLSIGGRFAETGVVLEGLASFKPDSPMGQSLIAFRPRGGNLLSRVSNSKYVLALGTSERSTQVSEQDKALTTNILDTLLASPPFSLLDDRSKADLKTLVQALNDQQPGGVQLVIGGAPEGSGLFAASMVFQCKDSAAMKELLLGACPLIETMIKTLAEEESLPFRIVAARQVATVDGLPVDAIEITVIEQAPQAAPTEPATGTEPMSPAVPAPAPAPEGEAAPANQAPADEAVAEATPAETTPAASAPAEETAVAEQPPGATEPAENPIATIMGEDKIRFYLVAVDPQTLVITFGGAQTHLASAVKTAKAGNGAILSDPAVAAALQVLPKNLAEVGLLNVGNLFDVIRHGAETMEGPNSGLPFQVASQTPIAVGVSISGSSAYATYYIPNELVAEVIGIIKKFATPAPMPMPESAPAATGDF